MEAHYRLERENERLQETLFVAAQKFVEIHAVNEHLENELRAARLKLERIGALAR